jgi:tryptophan-rich sensory protein
MAFSLRLILFLALNFGALALGGLFTGKGVVSDWYRQLNKAPWTPPGWVFGFAWTSIMVCFSFFMTQLTKEKSQFYPVVLLFIIQWLLNVSWNPLFFALHLTGWSMICIFSLLLSVCAFLFFTSRPIHVVLLLPYILWLIIACSLNAYIFLRN